MEPKLLVELSAVEIANLGKLIDLAVRGGGIDVAKAAIPIYQKLETTVADFNAASQKGSDDER